MAGQVGQFGTLAQLGYVVRNLDHAIRYWTESLGIGPFFVVRDLTLPEIVYRGQTQPLTMSVAYSHSGGMQLELIEGSPEPSIYKEAIDQNWVGLHHIGYMVDDFATALESAQRKGFEPIQSGAFGGTGFAYFDTGETESGAIIELIETSPAKWERFERIRDAAASWTGEDPIRLTAVAQLQKQVAQTV